LRISAGHADTLHSETRMFIDGELCNTRSGKKFETLNSAKPGTGGTVGKALALHSDGDKISFAGSTDVGKLMMVYAGESNLKRVTGDRR